MHILFSVIGNLEVHLERDAKVIWKYYDIVYKEYEHPHILVPMRRA